MLSYDTLDRIADAHNPLLGAAWLALSLAPLVARRWRLALARVVLGIACLLVAYGGMWVDDALHLWPRMGLDYSTHTAVALAMVATLGAVAWRLGAAAGGLFCAYALLMVHQGYHTPGDIFSTALAAGVPVFVVAWLARGAVRAQPVAAQDPGAVPVALPENARA